MGIEIDYPRLGAAFTEGEYHLFKALEAINIIKECVKGEPERTCHMVEVQAPTGASVQILGECSECGFTDEIEHVKHWQYCPNCGAKVVEVYEY